MKRRILNPWLIPASCVILLQCGGRGDVTVIKLAHGLSPSAPVHRAMQFLVERVSDKSNAKMRIDIYPSEQLGTERQCLELLQIGSLGMTKVSASVMENFAPSFQALSLPYIFRGEEHRFQVLDGPIGRKLLLEAERFRLRGLCFYDAGTRSFYTKDRPIERPEDLEGLKIRTQESATAMRMVNALGGSATPIPWGELYTALQQGVVDGAENNPPSFYLSRHYEVARYYSLNEHSGVPDVLLVSTIIWNELTADEKRWLQEAAIESAEHEKELWRKASTQALAAVQEAGVIVIRPDKALFADRLASMLELHRDEPEVYEVIRQIREAHSPPAPPIRAHF
jgi:tripartite ATP-independent transporter DctP family solute receptor